MMEMVMKRKQLLQKQGKKGFTLVELIVVIVILGILAAIAVPALVGYIDKARNDGAITEASTARTAMQTVVSDAYAHKGFYTSTDKTIGTSGKFDVLGTLDKDNLAKEIDNLTGTTGHKVNSMTVADGKVTAFDIKVPSQSATGKVTWDSTTNAYVVTP